jgi:hypothetical protein
MAQSFNYPAVAVTVPGGLDVNVHDASGNPIGSTAGALDVNATNPSIGTNGAAQPTSSTQIGAEFGGNLVSLKANASSELLISSATLATEATLSAMSAKLPATIGQKAMAASLAVAIASDQSAIPVSAASLPLPTGAATEATLAALSAKFGSLGQKAMAGSAPVVIASDQSAVPVSAASLPLPSGAATAANQATEIASLASIDGKLVDNFGAASGGLRTAAQIGNATGAADFNAGNKGAQTLRVVIATDQTSIPVTSGANPSGSYAEITNLTTSAQTFTAPANAVGFLLEALSDNSNNIRWKQGATATTSAGMRLEPGRDTGYVPCAANISVIAEAGSNQVVTVQWVLSV